MKNKLLIALFLFALTVPAFAEGTGSAAGFGDLDTNGDGVISREEASQHEGLTGSFDAADANQDGNLDNAEFAKIVGNSIDG